MTARFLQDSNFLSIFKKIELISYSLLYRSGVTSLRDPSWQLTSRHIVRGCSDAKSPATCVNLTDSGIELSRSTPRRRLLPAPGHLGGLGKIAPYSLYNSRKRPSSKKVPILKQQKLLSPISFI